MYTIPFYSDHSSLGEMENQISSLENSNFDLKLRLHYLSQKYRATGGNAVDREDAEYLSPSPLVASPSTLTNTLTQGVSQSTMSGDTLSLSQRITHHTPPRESPTSATLTESEIVHEENDFLRRRVLDLEAQNLQLTLCREREQREHEEALLSARPTAAALSVQQQQQQLQQQQLQQLQQEESRRRERDVALAIAEHDAALIQKLQDEIARQTSESERERETLRAVREECDRLQKTIQEKETEISRRSEREKELESMLESERVMRVTLSQTLAVASASQRVLTTSTPPHPSQRESRSSPQNTPSLSLSLSSPAPRTPSSSSSSTLQTPLHIPLHREQELSLREENALLRDRLTRLQQSIDSQDVMIKALQRSVQQLKCLEDLQEQHVSLVDNTHDEQLASREREVEMLRKEIDLLRERCQALERERDAQQKEIVKYRRSVESLQSEKKASAPPATPSNGNDVLSSRSKEVYERTIELYKQRETELLGALEGVVKRCQQLETVRPQVSPQSTRTPAAHRQSPLLFGSPSLLATPVSSNNGRTPQNRSRPSVSPSQR